MTDAIVSLYHQGITVEEMLPKLGKKALEMASAWDFSRDAVGGAVSALADAQLVLEANKYIEKYAASIVNSQEKANAAMKTLTDYELDNLVVTLQGKRDSEEAWTESSRGGASPFPSRRSIPSRSPSCARHPSRILFRFQR